jgi:hypothetical protein
MTPGRSILIANPERAHGSRRGRGLLVTAFAVALIAIALAATYHLTASKWYGDSFDRAATLDARAQSAQRAAGLEPWNSRYATRAIVMQKWRHAAILLSQGASLPATKELGEAYKLDIGDQELLALFKKSQGALAVDSNFKAHIQHAHEGPGGTLRPQDLMR